MASSAVFALGLKALCPNDAPAERNKHGKTEKIVPAATPIILIDFQTHQLFLIFSLSSE
jgi:hypothetical protein